MKDFPKDAKREWFDPEKPQHKVRIAEGFWTGKFEVTQAQWRSVMGDNPSYFKDCDTCPVEQVSWDDTKIFLKKLNQSNDGFVYSLPTEAQWEYGARAGTTGLYAGSLDDMSWYHKNSGSKTHPVGQKQPNAFGLYDMHGNVFEWCEDWYHNSYIGLPTDGTANLTTGEQKYRVLRGGSWNYLGSGIRSAFRGWYAPSFRYVSYGFRVRLAPSRSRHYSSVAANAAVKKNAFVVRKTESEL